MIVQHLFMLSRNSVNQAQEENLAKAKDERIMWKEKLFVNWCVRWDVRVKARDLLIIFNAYSPGPWKDIQIIWALMSHTGGFQTVFISKWNWLRCHRVARVWDF